MKIGIKGIAQLVKCFPNMPTALGATRGAVGVVGGTCHSTMAVGMSSQFSKQP